MLPKNTFSQADLKELDEFLVSDKAPEECMDISTLDGFLTAIVIGPKTIMPSHWLPKLWGEKTDDEMLWTSLEETNHIMGLIMSYYNSIVSVFDKDSKSFEPLFYVNTVKDKEITIIDEWCYGFMQGVGLSFDSWRPLIDSDEDRNLLTPIFLHGTEEGWEQLKKDGKVANIPHEKWVDLIPRTVIEIYKFWLPYRQSTAKAINQAISTKVGRNDPCPCGSGKKFKHCCLS